MRFFSGSVQLPTGLLVTSDCLANIVNGQSDGDRFSLSFPRPGMDGDALSPPESEEPEWLDDEDGRPRMWGLLIPEKDAAWVTSLAISLKTSAVATDAGRKDAQTYAEEVFSRSFTRWLDGVSSLLEIWTGQGIHRSGGPFVEGTIVDLFDHVTQFGFRSDTATDMTPIAHPSEGFRLITMRDLQSAADRVSIGVPLELAWQMFNHAQRLLKSDLRFAVIEACSAVEVAVSRNIAQSLFGHPDQARRLVLKGAGGIGGLIDLHNALYPPRIKGNNYMIDLVNQRNEIVHTGCIPTPEQAIQAIIAARFLLEKLSPLPPA